MIERQYIYEVRAHNAMLDAEARYEERKEHILEVASNKIDETELDIFFDKYFDDLEIFGKATDKYIESCVDEWVNEL